MEKTHDLGYKKLKRHTAFLSVATAIFLLLIKVIVGIFVGSMSIFASATDSLMDILASGINYYAIRKSTEKPTEDFSFGFGKIEGIAGLAQGVIIMCSAVAMAGFAIYRIVYGQGLVYLDLGMTVMIVSLVLSVLLVRRIDAVVAKTQSVVLKADALHYRTDIWTNTGVLITLLLVRLTGWTLIDPLVAVAIAFYIFWSATGVAKEAVHILLDKELPEATRKQIGALILSHDPKITSYHWLRTRNAGPFKVASFDLVLTKDLSLMEAHEIAESLVVKIQKEMGPIDVSVHMDPYDDQEEHAHQIIF